MSIIVTKFVFLAIPLMVSIGCGLVIRKSNKNGKRPHQEFTHDAKNLKKSGLGDTISFRRYYIC